MLRKVFYIVFLLIGPTNILVGQGLDFISGRLIPHVGIPLNGTDSTWKIGGGGEAQVLFTLPGGLSFLQPLIYGGYQVYPTAAEKNLSLFSGGIGAEFQFYPIPRFGVGVHGSGGIYSGTYSGNTSTNWNAKTGADLKIRITPAFSLNLGASYEFFQGKNQSLIETLSGKLGLNLSLGGLGESNKLTLESLETTQLYPVLYSQYDKNSLGFVRFQNREDGEIQNIKVSFYLKQYMDRPKDSFKLPSLGRGETAQAPLYALLTPEVLKLIESTKALGEVAIEYEFLGEKRTQRFDAQVKINNRNALSWDDDQKASAFVSSKDPAVLRYSKYTAGIISEGVMPGFNSEFKLAVGLFEGLKFMGVNYVVDPTTPYSEFSSKSNAVDFLQFPYQTLTYKGGDCDDLAILYSSILESVGIKTAFITIPGHIYMAFSPRMSIKEAKNTFPDLKEFIIQNGQLWVPVEITLLKTNFAKAWSVGAQEWRDNISQAMLIPMTRSWGNFDPVSPPDQDTRIVLPGEAELAGAIRAGLDKLSNSVLPAKVEALNRELSSTGERARVLNKLGILHAQWGRLNEAKNYFLQAGQAGFRLSDTNLGNIALLEKDLRGARQFFERSLRGNPQDGPTILGLAISLYEAEKYSESSAQFKRLQDVDPVLAEQFSFLGGSLKRTKEDPLPEKTQESGNPGDNL